MATRGQILAAAVQIGASQALLSQEVSCMSFIVQLTVSYMHKTTVIKIGVIVAVVGVAYMAFNITSNYENGREPELGERVTYYVILVAGLFIVMLGATRDEKPHT
ncbi:hypothetical protein CENSYa_0160 [Cenarchaeum symbiosum A]|uniref:Uncharacterized protein n=1 Tax=Cenarchaeum symbiosum (strain A) TaxID=414004 RepID=A0RTY8_CENSY|nr:hypothetical protein CENSYa_0160 [Cenarchaeum symbiosum A]